MSINYHGKRFSVRTNSENGETSEDTVFHYQQEGTLLTCVYHGGKIRFGQLMGKVDENGVIDMRYQQINSEGALMTGICHSTPEILPDGRIRLHERWQWTSGDNSEGYSVLEEIP